MKVKTKPKVLATRLAAKVQRRDMQVAGRLTSGLKRLSIQGGPGVQLQPIKSPAGSTVRLSITGPAVAPSTISTRRLWHAKLPVLACNGCQFAAQCPQFRAGYECAFSSFSKDISIKTEEDVLAYARELASLSLKRAVQVMIGEQLSGSAPTLEQTEALANIFSQLMALYDRMSTRAEVTVDDAGGTIIGKLFGGAGGLLEATEQTLSTPIELPNDTLSAGEEAQRNLAAGLIEQSQQDD